MQRPRLGSTHPVLGANVTVSGQRAPAGGVRLLFVGVAAPPFTVPGLVAPGCSVWANLAVPTIPLPHPPGAQWTLTFPLVNDPRLLGAIARVQAVYGSVPLSVSNALQWGVGR